jgi:chorismate synthase
MASNSFGQHFRITTFGESHGPGIGVVIDGCPPGVELTAHDIDQELARRRPGQNGSVSPRREPDLVEILSGVFEGRTTGAPIALLIRNRDADSSAYDSLKHLYRPGHANFTYLQKYGIFDHRGGGRASARETAARVAAGAVAKKMLFGRIDCLAYIAEIGGIPITGEVTREKVYASPLFCPDEKATLQILAKLDSIQGDSLGGIVACTIQAPAGLGDPIYEKLEAKLASAMLSIPASKGFEIGEGFAAARMLGSEHNDTFISKDKMATNHAGGTLGGISTGAPIHFRVAFKPTSSIAKSQPTVNLNGEPETIQTHGRHDPCVAIRAVPVVEAMATLVMADALLSSKVFSLIDNY